MNHFEMLKAGNLCGSGGGGSAPRIYSNATGVKITGEELMDPADMTALYSTSIPFGGNGTKVAARLAINDAADHTALMEQGWNATGSCYYEQEHEIGAYGGYRFSEPTPISQVKFWIGKYTTQNAALPVSLQFAFNGSWRNFTIYRVSSAIDYPLNIITCKFTDISPLCTAVRWIHEQTPEKSGGNNVIFFGMQVFKATGSEIPIFVPNLTQEGLPIVSEIPEGYDGFADVFVQPTPPEFLYS